MGLCQSDCCVLIYTIRRGKYKTLTRKYWKAMLQSSRFLSLGGTRLLPWHRLQQRMREKSLLTDRPSPGNRHTRSRGTVRAGRSRHSPGPPGSWPPVLSPCPPFSDCPLPHPFGPRQVCPQLPPPLGSHLAIGCLPNCIELWPDGERGENSLSVSKSTQISHQVSTVSSPDV